MQCSGKQFFLKKTFRYQERMKRRQVNHTRGYLNKMLSKTENKGQGGPKY